MAASVIFGKQLIKSYALSVFALIFMYLSLLAFVNLKTINKKKNTFGFFLNLEPNHWEQNVNSFPMKATLSSLI